MKRILFFITSIAITFVSFSAFANGVEIGGIHYLLDAGEHTAAVTFIGSYVGENTYQGDIEIPASVTYEEEVYTVTKIGEHAFSGGAITSINMPNTITSIDNFAFWTCAFLEHITLPTSVTSIGQQAFCECNSITEVIIPSSVTNLSSNVFSDCSSLASITVEAGNPIYDSRDNCNAIIITESNTLLTGCKNTIIPNSVTSLWQGAFYYCRTLSSINIPPSINCIPKLAFLACTALTDISLSPNITTIEEDAFSGCSSLKSIELPSALVSIGNRCFEACRSLTSITIPASVTDIGARVFSSTPSMESMVVEEGNTVYDSRENCNAIIETASNTLIAGCNNTIIPSDIINIGDHAFAGVLRNKHITIPSSIKHIGSGAFTYGHINTILSITCLAAIPPTLGDDVFDGTPYGAIPSNIPLYVHASSVPLYQAAEQWRDFDVQPFIVAVEHTTPQEAKLAWLPMDSASQYQLHIQSTDKAFALDTTLVVNADPMKGGILIPGQKMPQRILRIKLDDIGTIIVISIDPQSGTSAEDPYIVSVSTESSEKIDIKYDMKVYHIDKLLMQEQGSFMLNEPLLSNCELSNPTFRSTILYDLQGRGYPVEQYQTLPAGIYILRENGITKKIIKS